MVTQYTTGKWKQPRYLSTDEWIIKCGIFKKWKNIQLLRKKIMKIPGK